MGPPACCPQSPAPSYIGATSARRTGRGCWRWEWPASGLCKDREITRIGKRGQGNKDRETKTGKQGQENKDRETKTGKQGQGNKDRETRIGKQGQANKDRQGHETRTRTGKQG